MSGFLLEDGQTLDCDVSSHFADAELIRKNSASPTEVLFAKLRKAKTRISIKLFLDTTNKPGLIPEDTLAQVEGLKYEVKVYRDIVSRILKGNYSPNFVGYIGYGKCSMASLKYLLTDYEYSTITRNFQNIYPELRGTTISEAPLRYLVTEKAGSGKKDRDVFNLYSIINSGKLSEEEKKQIFFQIIYSVAVMQQFRLVHNDMHPRNILVAERKKPVDWYYKIGSRIYHVKSKYIPYLFDWDFAYCGALGPNPKIDINYFCEDINICNRFSRKTDLYILFCDLGFNSPIEKAYFSKLIYKKEKGIGFKASKSTQEKLAKIMPYAENIAEGTLYKLSHRELRYVFGDKVYEIFGVNVSSAILEYFKIPGIVKVFKGFHCRPTAFSANFPEPLDLIREKFGDMEVKEIIHSEKTAVFTFPKSVDTKARIYRDPRSPSTRNKIVGSPTFRPVLYKENLVRLKRLEKQQKLTPENWAKNHPDLKPKMRKTLVGWMNEICEKYCKKYKLDVFSLSVKLLDQYITKTTYIIDRKHLQLVGGAAMSVVSEKIAPGLINARHITFLSAKIYSYDDVDSQIKKMQKFYRNFGKIVTTPDFFSVVDDEKELEHVRSIASQILSKKIPDLNYLEFSPSIVASTIIWMSLKKWPSKYANRLGYSQDMLEPCRKFLVKEN